MKRFLMTLLLSIVCIFASGQAVKNIHVREQLWTGYFNQTRLTKRIGLWLDVHYRQTDHFLDRPFQFIVRPAVNIYLKDKIRLQTGYARIEHFPARGLTTSRPEHRAWQQLWWNQKHAGFSTLQWLRLEQRFNRKVANDVLLDEYNRSSRLRYNLAFFIPLKGKELVAKTPFLAVMDEVFVNLGKNVAYNTFDQNRFFVGLGYQIHAHLNIQGGYMNIFQQESSGNSYWSTHAFRLFVFQTLDFRQEH